ncbi:MAG: creatininase family protein [Bacteroidales bacterium]|nr:creatininase family protein [Bacteroidales bacterium]
MRPYILAETNWEALKDASIDLAVLPWGATEAHNFHLPYSTDNIESDHIAAGSAAIAWENGARVMVLPTVPYGVNTGQKDIFLTINMNPATQHAILNDIIEGLERQGVHKLLIMNSHGGNDFKPMVRELGLRYPEMFIGIAEWFRMPDVENHFDRPGDHAGEMETSLLLYLRSELVLPQEKWGKGKEKKNRILAFGESWAWTERKWPQVSEDTGIGDPASASKEKGEGFYHAACKRMAELFIEICNADINDMYE